MDGLLELENRIVASVDPARTKHARAIVRFASGIVPWGLLFILIFLFAGQTAAMISLIVSVSGVSGAVPILWRTGSVRVASHVMTLALGQALVVPAWLLGGIEAACIPWFGICIVVTTYVSGLKDGAIWTAISAVVVGGFFVAEAAGWVPPPAIDGTALYALMAVTHIGLFVVVFALVIAATRVDERHRGELEIARRAADEASRAKSTFLANMSHELRTPMNAVIGYAELLIEDADEDSAEDLRRIARAGGHLLGLVNDILDLSKVEAGEMEFAEERVDVRALLDDVLEHTSPLFAASGNQATVEVGGGVMATADGMRVRQCLINLVSNATKFTRDGSITLRAFPRDSMVRIEVEDTGVGIAEDRLDAVFEPFRQADAGVQRTHGGTGLGLALVRQFIHRMGGRVDVQSTVGSGTTFGFTLPVWKA